MYDYNDIPIVPIQCQKQQSYTCKYKAGPVMFFLFFNQNNSQLVFDYNLQIAAQHDRMDSVNNINWQVNDYTVLYNWIASRAVIIKLL